MRAATTLLAALVLAATMSLPAAAAGDVLAPPAEGITRAEVTAVAARTLATLRGDELPTAPMGFSDVAGHVLSAEIAAAAADGLVRGYPDGTFRPDAPATDTHRDVILARLRAVLEAEGLVLPGDPMPAPIIATFDTPEGSFRVLIDDPGAINRLAGAEVGTHVGIPNGRLVRGDGGVNTGHDWHLVEVEIVDMAMEVCDGTAAYIDRLGYDEFVAQHGDRFCPWGAIYLGSQPAPAA